MTSENNDGRKAEHHPFDWTTMARALDSLPIPVAIKDRHFKYRYANKMVLKLLGKDAGQVVGTRAGDNFPQADAARFEEAQHRVLETGETVEIEREMPDLNGNRGLVKIRYDRIVDDAGEPLVRLVVTDVAALNSEVADKARQISVREEAIARMVQGLMVYDNERIEFISDRALELLEFPPDAVRQGDKWTAYFEYLYKRGDYGEGDEAKRKLDQVIADIRQGKPHKVERRAPSGRALLIEGEPRKDGGFITTISDVTEQKAREAELERAREAAALADRAKSEFLANMSHEIRTPLNGVMGMAELLAKTKLDSRQQMFAEVIMKSGSTLLTIINDILDFSKIDAGQMELASAPFSLAEAIEDVATLASSTVAEKGLELIVRIDPGLPQTLVGDEDRFRQVVTNLIGNAVKFTDQGHVYVNVDATVAGGVARLRVEVQDTGIGIPEDKCHRVFEKFSQVDGSASRRHQGTGLGLAIASSLVDLMGGQINVESVEGEGSTFWFEIELPFGERQLHFGRAPVDVTGSRILVVDDNSVNRAILLEQMAAWHFEGVAVTSGPEALVALRDGLARNAPFHCVVLDYHMPGMNGVEVANEMRRTPELAGVPVVMLTSVSETEEGGGFRTLDIQGHLVKPARSSVLLDTLSRVLQQAASGRTTPAGATETTTAMQRGHGAGALAAGPVGAPGAQDEDSAYDEAEDPIDVLVCEDNDVNQILFEQVLKVCGLSFRIASDGAEGVALYKTLQPKIVIMDVSMPEMDGFEATSSIREMEAQSGAHTPIIGVTAHAIEGDRDKCLRAGMDDYLSKPVSPDRLTETVNRWLGKQRARAHSMNSGPL